METGRGGGAKSTLARHRMSRTLKVLFLLVFWGALVFSVVTTAQQWQRGVVSATYIFMLVLFGLATLALTFLVKGSWSRSA